MADPVTLAAIGAVAGAATNKKDPIKGALLGAGLGFGGGTIAPALLGTGAAAGGAAGAGAAGAAGTAAAAPAAAGTGFMAKAMAPGTLLAAGNLAANLAPKPGPAISLPMRPGQQSPLSFDQIQAIQSGLFDTVPLDRRMTTMVSRFGREPVPFMNDLEPTYSTRLSLL